MQALILAGGEGTRLRPLTLNTPKPIVPIGNQPFLLRQIELLKAAGITDITMSLNYQPSAIEKVLGDGSDFGVHLRYLIEPAPMGTAGAYKFAEDFLETTTLVLNGDILTDIDLQKVVEHHKNLNSAATIVLIEVENPSAYGLVEVGENSQILRFLEKPKAHELEKITVRTINAGIYIFEPRILQLIPHGENYSFEYQLFPDLLHRRERFHAYIAQNDYWLDIGTPERYLQANADLIGGKIKNLKLERTQNFQIGDDVEIDEKSHIADGCLIKDGARILNSVLGKNVVIEEGVTIENSIIWTGTIIDAGATITDSVAGYSCRIGRNAIVSRNSMLGDKTVLTDFTRLAG